MMSRQIDDCVDKTMCRQWCVALMWLKSGCDLLPLAHFSMTTRSLTDHLNLISNSCVSLCVGLLAILARVPVNQERVRVYKGQQNVTGSS